MLCKIRYNGIVICNYLRGYHTVILNWSIIKRFETNTVIWLRKTKQIAYICSLLVDYEKFSVPTPKLLFLNLKQIGMEKVLEYFYSVQWQKR